MPMDNPCANTGIVVAADAVLLEGMRTVHCHDSPVNSVVAAGAASYILVSNHSALPRILPFCVATFCG